MKSRSIIGYRRSAAKPILALTLGISLAFVGYATEPTSEQLEFFEKQIRPILAERCYQCHSTRSEKLKGGLLLDSYEGLIKGGEDGPVVSLDAPEKSKLIEAINYQNPDLQMPPKGKLPDDQIAALTEWVKMGVPWPKQTTQELATPASAAFDLEKRRREHWAWQPITAPEPPSVKDNRWPAIAPDHFILAKLEQNHLQPASPTDPRTLIRRLYFDLVGLPPTPQQAEQFLADSSARAYEKVVDRLLASPQFGERWARHWLDLVRYAETLGHEFDYPLQNAWRYRDYVIRAFNADVPYNQFVVEHIAGDLIPDPRVHPVEHFNESIIGTGFFWLGQRDHSPVDIRQHQAELIDNQIDVMCKTFLGLTVSCARCHDHKFDAIASKDFYALYGVLESSRYAQRAIDGPDPSKIEKLKRFKKEIRRAAASEWSKQVEQISKYLLAANAAQTNSHEAKTASDLDPALLARWSKALGDKSISDPGHPLYAWIRLSPSSPVPAAWSRPPSGAEGVLPLPFRRGEGRGEGSIVSSESKGATRRIDSSSPKSAPQFQQQWRRLLEEALAQPPTSSNYESFVEASQGGFDKWFPDGSAFLNGSGGVGEFIVGDSNSPITILREPTLNDAVLSPRLEGSLRSPSFVIRHPYLHILAAGRASRIRVCIDNFTMIREPIYGGLMKVVDADQPKWFTFDLTMWPSHRAFIEFCDVATPDPADDSKKDGCRPNGYISASRALFSNLPTPPAATNPLAWLLLLGSEPPASMKILAKRYQKAARQALQSWGSSDSTNQQSNGSNPRLAQLAFLDWLVQNRLLDTSGSLASLVANYRQVESAILEPINVPALADGDGVDEHIFIRGNPKTPGDIVPRQFLTALSNGKNTCFKSGSGRLELAHCLTDPANPFLARVMVNRVWLHLFGRGLVPTPDDFGKLGQPPTHPELLDWLANWYRAEAGWSTKKLIRLLVNSSTYRMSSKPADPAAEEKDPDNLFFHRMPVRRLEGEVIRDAMLAVSGRLDNTLFGPSIPIPLTEFMDGRGRPTASGPLDGAGRRSIYLEARRNFLSPMMRAFDTPVPFTTIGKRTVSNVPAQSLILLNDPFVLGQAQLCARRILDSQSSSPEDRVKQIYLMAFARPPTAAEQGKALAFLQQQAVAYGIAPSDCLQNEKVWADLCHVAFNLKEFIFLQ